MDLSFILGAQRDALIAERDQLLEEATPETFTEETETRVSELNTQIRELGDRLTQARTDETTEAETRSAVTEVPGTAVVLPESRGSIRVTREPNPVYREDGKGRMYFRDLFYASSGGLEEQHEARENLLKGQESRALTTAATAGGTFAPPDWMVAEYIALARAARVTADLVQGDVLPGGVSSINLPQVTSGTTEAVVQTQNTQISNTDLVTSSVSSGITTIAGQQIVSLQLLRQSAIPFDRVILGDLAAAYGTQLDVQVINGSGANGQLKGLITAGTTVTYTSAAPSVISTTAANSFYNKVINGMATVATTRFLPADSCVMSPTRWGWILEALDGQSRPLVVPNGPIYNNLAVSGEPVAQGIAGTFGGLPVYVDPNIPANLGGGTNQDVAFVLRKSDHWLYETPTEQTTWEATYANQNSVLFRVLGFSAFLTRYSGSAQVIAGTGMVVPTL